MKPILWAALLLFPIASVTAQTTTPQTDNPQKTAVAIETVATQAMQVINIPGRPGASAGSYIGLQLPPLQTLLDNARERSSQVNMFSAKQDYEERELRTIRRNWMRYIKLNGSFSYGTNDASSQIYYEDTHYPPVYNTTGVTQRWWNVGASVSLPLDEIFNRRNKIKQQKNRIASIEYEVESWYDEICMRIIDCYTTATQYLSVLDATSQAMITAQAQYSEVEADFINGRVDAQMLSRQQNIATDAVRVYEETRALLTRALLQLEVLSKTQIISKPEETPEN